MGGARECDAVPAVLSRGHQGAPDGAGLAGGEGDGEGDRTSIVFVPYNRMLHSGAFEDSSENGSSVVDSERELLSTEFVQKYISYVKFKMCIFKFFFFILISF